MVSSYAVDTEAGVLLFDPLDVPAELRERASVVVLTCPWHRRDAPQLGLPIYVPPPDPPDPDPVRGEVFRSGDTLPFGVRAFEGFEPNDLVLYVESRRAVVVGDTLIDRGNRLILAELAAVGGGPPSPTTGGGAAAKSLRWPRVCVLQRPSCTRARGARSPVLSRAHGDCRRDERSTRIGRTVRPGRPQWSFVSVPRAESR